MDVSKEQVQAWFKQSQERAKQLNQQEPTSPTLSNPVRKIYATANQIKDKTLYFEPYITKNDFNQTMHKYRTYRNAYNIWRVKQNKEIKIYNAEVQKNLQSTKLILSDFNHIQSFLTKWRLIEKTEDFQKTKLDYNKAVIAANDNYGKKLLKQKTLSKIGDAYSDIFAILLGFYASQIRTKTTNLRQQDQLSRRVLAKLDLNYTNMEKHQIKGVKKATCTIKTIQNRINVFKDAGIIQGYKFRGSRTSVLMEINPKILTVSDVNPYNREKSINQLIISSDAKNLHNISDSKFSNTKINLKRNKKADFLNACPADGLLNYRSKEIPKQYKPRTEEKRKKIAPKKEKDLKSVLTSYYNFGNQLQEQQPKIPLLEIKDLEKEKDFGYLDREQYTKLVIEQLVLLAYHLIFKNHKYIKVYSGNVQNTCKMLEQRFKVNGFYLKKAVMFKTYSNWCNVIKQADKQIKKAGYEKTLNLFDWFDATRKNKESGGIHYVFLKYHIRKKDQEHKISAYQKKRNRQLANAERRKAERYNRMFANAINRFKLGKYKTLDQLYLYVLHNLPKKYMNKYNYLVANNKLQNTITPNY